MEPEQKENLFQDFATDYDRMINWEVRLKREEPFFRRVFQEGGVQTVLDAACATGRHAILFKAMGYDAAGSDASPDMVLRAIENARAAGQSIGFSPVRLEELDTFWAADFDAVTCLGNSLPHLRTAEDLDRTVRSVARVLHDEGWFVFQIRNYTRLYDRREVFMPVNSRMDGGREYLYLRFNELGESQVGFHIVCLTKDEAGKWFQKVESEWLKPWKLEDLEPVLTGAGFMMKGVYGDYNFGSFDPLKSADLIVIARKHA